MNVETINTSRRSVTFESRGVPTEHSSFYFQGRAGKIQATVGFTAIGAKSWVQVLCENASHKAWAKFGRTFLNAEVALNHYKSAEMKAIIRAADAAYRGTTATSIT